MPSALRRLPKLAMPARGSRRKKQFKPCETPRCRPMWKLKQQNNTSEEKPFRLHRNGKPSASGHTGNKRCNWRRTVYRA
eukprot:9440576-Pyramimonas_sp.AAC.1